VSLQLTPEGSERAAQAKTAMSRYRTSLLASSVSPEDMKVFGRVLWTIAGNATNKASSA
jgi:hypothetical protein